MDRNTVIGFSLLAALLIGYIFYNQKQQDNYYAQKKADSLAYVKKHPVPVVDTAAMAQLHAAADTAADSALNAMPAAYHGQAQTIRVENKKVALEFSTKGAFPVSAQLKDYKTYGQKDLFVFNGKGNSLSAILPVPNKSVATGDLYYIPTITDGANGSKVIDFMADMGDGKKVDIIYTLPADNYMMECSIKLTGMMANSLPLTWETNSLHTERDVVNERSSSQFYYRFTNKDHDYFTIANTQKKSLEERTHWLGMRMHYFNSTLVADEGFSKVNIDASIIAPAADTNTVAHARNTMDVPVGNGGVAAMKWYIGPNHYKTLSSYNIGMEEMVPLGYGIMAFVKYINKWIIIPIFNVLSGFITNYGIIIMLMTIFIRLILSFFTYKSYLSAAKMRVLKPELDELRARLGDDQQKFGMEQMKLYRSAGVNPLGGCLPTLFQMPILFAMYYFFPSSIELRQKSFLWAQDLSTYDSIAQLPFKIPGFGDHISLFTLLMTASSLFLALYNKNMTQDPNNPMMKYLPYIFPFILLGVFNNMAAALTFYYFFSNTISIAQQFIIQKYFINEKAIHAQMQENKNKPATPSKWAQRIEEMQKAQQDRAKQQPRKK